MSGTSRCRECTKRETGEAVKTQYEVTSPVPSVAWRNVLIADERATVHQTWEWFQAAHRATRASDASRLYQLDDGRQLVVPLLRRGPGALAVVEGYPRGYGSGGILATGGLRSADVRLVLSDLLGISAVAVQIKSNHDTVSCWEAGVVPGAMVTNRRVDVVDLAGGFPQVWDKRFESSARQAVRKAERSSLSVERGTSSQLVLVFYDLYLAWTRRRAVESGLPAALTVLMAKRREPLRKFLTLAAAIGDGFRTWVAWHEGEAVAAIITLVYKEHVTYWAGYSRKELAGPLRANNLLHKLAIEDACAEGARYYNMGESGGVASLMRFKRTLGAMPQPGVDCRIERLPLHRFPELRGEAESLAARAIATARSRSGRSGSGRSGSGRSGP